MLYLSAMVSATMQTHLPVLNVSAISQRPVWLDIIPWLENGFCNNDTNIAECYCDGGDCCGYCINSEHCTECTCFHQETCLAGVTHAFIGVCNDETNFAEYDYDGLDCCGLAKAMDALA